MHSRRLTQPGKMTKSYTTFHDNLWRACIRWAACLLDLMSFFHLHKQMCLVDVCEDGTCWFANLQTLSAGDNLSLYFMCLCLCNYICTIWQCTFYINMFCAHTPANSSSVPGASVRGQTERQCQEHNYTNLLGV